jgi:EAL domain-containing protein (putative c-di-GMP-specific phosphodiesterase class I)
MALVQGAGVKPEALELEITESLIMHDVERSNRALSVLRGAGIHVSMDDFGTGYSSLSYLASLPVDKIKIDRSFIAGMTENALDRKVVSTIISLAHSFGFPVVAEGVETVEQAQALHDLNCDEAQGFLFSRPLPSDEVIAMFDAPRSASTNQ